LNYVLQRSYGFFVGTVMLGVTGFYARKTYGDMKHIFSETLSYELNKKPEDIWAWDLWRSKNAIVHRTVKNIFNYNKRRAIWVNLPFFNFLVPGFYNMMGGNVTNLVDLGVGSTGGYLVTDAIWRRETFFEALQKFIDQKINHMDRSGDIITTADLISLYDRHAKDKNKDYSFSGRMDTKEWQDNQRLFGRMAELMNQTYGNVPNQEGADLIVPKLLYLLGHGLINPRNMEQSLAYIEVASRYPGMDEVKKIEQAVKSGATMQQAIQPFVSVPAVQAEAMEIARENSAVPPQESSYAARLAGEGRPTIRDMAASTPYQKNHADKTRGSLEGGLSTAPAML
jgi:hypothetical protein